MKINRAFYVLRISADISAGEGEDWDEWFSTLSKAVKRRKDLIKMDPELRHSRVREDYAIDYIELVECGPRQLILKILNGKGYVEKQVRIYEPYQGRQDFREEEE